jgi:hypothetical protein
MIFKEVREYLLLHLEGGVGAAKLALCLGQSETDFRQPS